MDPTLGAVIIAVTVPTIGLMLKYLQDRGIAKAQEKRDAAAATLVAGVAAKVEVATAKVEENTAKADDKLSGIKAQNKEIHDLVNSQLTEAVNRFKDSLKTIEELKAVISQLTTKQTEKK